jgi:hypothetical protein
VNKNVESAVTSNCGHGHFDANILVYNTGKKIACQYIIWEKMRKNNRKRVVLEEERICYGEKDGFGVGGAGEFSRGSSGGGGCFVSGKGISGGKASHHHGTDPK